LRKEARFDREEVDIGRLQEEAWGEDSSEGDWGKTPKSLRQAELQQNRPPLRIPFVANKPGVVNSSISEVGILKAVPMG
jgi:hypothetical protein